MDHPNIAKVLIVLTTIRLAAPGRVEVWDAAQREMVWRITTEQAAVTMADFSHDGHHLALGTMSSDRSGGHVELWDWQSKSEVRATQAASAFLWGRSHSRRTEVTTW